jgi:hypothetical protein
MVIQNKLSFTTTNAFATLKQEQYYCLAKLSKVYLKLLLPKEYSI